MNTNTGATYRLSGPISDYLYGRDDANFAEAEARVRRHLTPDERDAVAAVRAGDPVVPVSPHVAQAMAIGRRELERRRRRRRAATQARKRNR